MYGVALKLGMILRSTVTFAAGYGEVTVGRRLFQLLVEPQHAEPQNGYPKNRQRQYLGPKGFDTGALKKHAPDNLHEVPYRIKESQPLGELWHVADRKRKSAQHEEWLEEQAGGHHRLGLCFRNSGNVQTGAERR